MPNAVQAVSAYRKRTIECATPQQLVTLLFEGAVIDMRRAIYAIDSNDESRRDTEVSKALDILTHLQSTLDFEQGGSVAPQLHEFYAVMRTDLEEANAKASKPMFEEVVVQLTSVKKAWMQATARKVPSIVPKARPPQPRIGVTSDTSPKDGPRYVRLPA